MSRDSNDHPAPRSNLRKLFSTVPFFLLNTPTNPHKVIIGIAVPEGLALVHCAPTTAEADLMRQILQEAGFHPEYVSSASAGLFGTSGSANVCVPKDESEEVRSFLTEYFANAPEDQQSESE